MDEKRSCHHAILSLKDRVHKKYQNVCLQNAEYSLSLGRQFKLRGLGAYRKIDKFPDLIDSLSFICKYSEDTCTYKENMRIGCKDLS
jgi:hypothetical protein